MQDRQVPSGPRNLVLPNGAKTVSPQKSNKCKKRSSKSQTKEATQLPYGRDLKDELVKIVPNNLPNKIEEDWIRKLWDEIQEANACKEEQGKALLTELDLEKPQVDLGIQSRYNMAEPSDTSSSKASSMKELPSFLGNDVESVDDVRKTPSEYKPSASVLDTTTLHALLSAKVKVMMTLAEVLKKRPKLWIEVMKGLRKWAFIYRHLMLSKELLEKLSQPRCVNCKGHPLGWMDS